MRLDSVSFKNKFRFFLFDSSPVIGQIVNLDPPTLDLWKIVPFDTKSLKNCENGTPFWRLDAPNSKGNHQMELSEA